MRPYDEATPPPKGYRWLWPNEFDGIVALGRIEGPCGTGAMACAIARHDGKVDPGDGKLSDVVKAELERRKAVLDSDNDIRLRILGGAKDAPEAGSHSCWIVRGFRAHYQAVDGDTKIDILCGLLRSFGAQGLRVTVL